MAGRTTHSFPAVPSSSRRRCVRGFRRYVRLARDPSWRRVECNRTRQLAAQRRHQRPHRRCPGCNRFTPDRSKRSRSFLFPDERFLIGKKGKSCRGTKYVGVSFSKFLTLRPLLTVTVSRQLVNRGHARLPRWVRSLSNRRSASAVLGAPHRRPSSEYK